MANIQYKTLKDCFYGNLFRKAGTIISVDEKKEVPVYFTKDLKAEPKPEDFTFFDAPKAGLRHNPSVENMEEIDALRQQAYELGIKVNKNTTVLVLRQKIKAVKMAGLPK